MTANFAVLAADPPWSFGDKLPGAARGAEKNYSVMSVEDMCRLQLPELAPDAYLFLWRVSSQVEEAYRVVRAWGFVPKSEIVWEKLTPSGKPWFGMGRHVRASHETAIVAVRGRPKPISRSIRSRFAAPVPTRPRPAITPATRGAWKTGHYVHSAKPEAFYDLIEQLAAGPYCELFARRQRPGWTCLGDQMPSSPVVIGVEEPAACSS